MSIYNHESVDSSCSNSLIWRRGKMVHFTSGFQEEVNSWSAKSDWWTARSLFVGELVWPVTLAVWVEDFAGKETRRTHTHTHTHTHMYTHKHTCTHTRTRKHTYVSTNQIRFGSHYWDFVPTSGSITWLFSVWSYSAHLNCSRFHFSLNTHLITLISYMCCYQCF